MKLDTSRMGLSPITKKPDQILDERFFRTAWFGRTIYDSQTRVELYPRSMGLQGTDISDIGFVVNVSISAWSLYNISYLTAQFFGVEKFIHPTNYGCGLAINGMLIDYPWELSQTHHKQSPSERLYVYNRTLDVNLTEAHFTLSWEPMTYNLIEMGYENERDVIIGYSLKYIPKRFYDAYSNIG